MNDAEKDELIGLDIEVVEAKNKSNTSIKGKIIDETKNTLTVKTKDGKKTLLKKSVKIRIRGEKISGDSLLGRPEDRIRKR